jgi:hypothetical protein
LIAFAYNPANHPVMPRFKRGIPSFVRDSRKGWPGRVFSPGT